MAFDIQANIATTIRRESGPQEIEVRWPTDEEWIERSKGWSIMVQRLGRGVSETQVDTAQADIGLYGKIRVNGSPELEAAEAQKVIEALIRCDITDVALSMDVATVSMTVMGGMKVQHTLRIPTTAEVTGFRRAAVRIMDLPHGRQKLRTNLHAGASLWAQCRKEIAGYAGAIPITHQDAAIRAVIEACEVEAEASKDEDF